MSGCLFGAFDLDSHATPPTGYYVIGRPLGTTQITPVLTPVARYEGVKVNGQFIGSKSIKLSVKVVGSSRSSLESLLDALYLALNIPLQQLKLHTLDTRYFVASAVYAPADMTLGEILAKQIDITFVCPSPYALASAGSTYDSGIQALALSGGAYPYSFNVTGGGTVFSRPTVQIINQRIPISTQLTSALVSGNAYTSLNVNALTAAVYAGDVLTLSDRHTPPIGGDPTQTVIVAAGASIGATSISVVSFIANFSYPINSGGGSPTFTTVTVDIHWTAVTLQQNTDNQYWSVSGAANPGSVLCSTNGEYLLFTSDPNTGISVVDSAFATTPLNFAGSPVTLNSASTPYTLVVSSVSVPIVEVVFTWNSRFLS